MRKDVEDPVPHFKDKFTEKLSSLGDVINCNISRKNSLNIFIESNLETKKYINFQLLEMPKVLTTNYLKEMNQLSIILKNN